MAVDFESLITKHAAEDGSIPAGSIPKIAASISSAVGREFVAKDRYNTKLEEIETLKSEKQTAEDTAAAAGKWEKKYNDLKSDFDTFKADTEAKAKLADVKAAYRKLLTDSGIDPKRHDVVIRSTDFNGMKLGEDGELEKLDDLKKAIDADWSDFKVTTRTQGVNVENPPKDSGGTGANPRAAQLAKQFHERRYGPAPAEKGTNNE